MKTKELKLNELIIFEGRIYKVIKTKYARRDKKQGHRVILKLLKDNELNKMFVKKLK